MPTNLLLLPLLGGYWFLHTFYYTRFRSQRLDGYRLLVESALLGVVLGVLARLTVLLCRQHEPLRNAWFSLAGFDLPYLGTAFGSLLLGMTTPYGLNWSLARAGWLTRETAQLKAIHRHGNHLLRLLHSASAQERTISLTLQNRKVYIGLVAAAPNLEAHDTYVTIIPFFSGHRETESLDLRLSVSYLEVFESGALSPADCKVTVPVSAILMTSFFDHSAMPAFTILQQNPGSEEHSGN